MIGNARPCVATEFLCHDKAWAGVVEARDDKVPLACDRMHDARAYCAHDILDSVHGVCALFELLFMGIVHGHCSKKKNPKFQPPGIEMSQKVSFQKTLSV